MKNKEIKRKIRILQNVAYYVLDSYGVFPFIDIEVIEPLSEDEYAYARKDDDDLFCIEISRSYFETASLAELISTTCHEAVHIKQFMLDGLDFEVGKWTWKGKRIKDNEKTYWFYPWEVEARGMQDAFAQTFIEENNIEHETAA